MAIKKSKVGKLEAALTKKETIYITKKSNDEKTQIVDTIRFLYKNYKKQEYLYDLETLSPYSMFNYVRTNKAPTELWARIIKLFLDKPFITNEEVLTFYNTLAPNEQEWIMKHKEEASKAKRKLS